MCCKMLPNNKIIERTGLAAPTKSQPVCILARAQVQEHDHPRTPTLFRECKSRCLFISGEDVQPEEAPSLGDENSIWGTNCRPDIAATNLEDDPDDDDGVAEYEARHQPVHGAVLVGRRQGLGPGIARRDMEEGHKRLVEDLSPAFCIGTMTRLITTVRHVVINRIKTQILTYCLY